MNFILIAVIVLGAIGLIAAVSQEPIAVDVDSQDVAVWLMPS